MALLRYSWRHLGRKRGRSALTLAGVALGVAAVVGVGVTLDTARTAHDDMFSGLAGRAGLEILAEGRANFDADAVHEACQVDGISARAGILRAAAALVTSSGVTPLLVVGVDPAADAAARDLTPAEGRPLSEIDGLLLDREFAASLGLSAGQTATLLATSGVQTLPVAGLLPPGGATAFNAGAVAYVRLPAAQRLFRAPGAVNAVQLVLSDPANAPAVERRVRERLPPGFNVQAPAAQAALAAPMLQSTHHGLSAISVVSIVAGACVILNTLLMSVGERRRDFAILRALGATTGQIRAVVQREALVMGVVGTALGIALGLGSATGLAASVEQAVGSKFTGLRITPGPILSALILGPGVCLVAARLATRAAGRRSPLVELSGVVELRAARPPRWPAIAGVALLAVMIAFVAALRMDAVPPAWLPACIPAGMAVICAAIALLAAAAAPGVLARCEPAARRLLGAEAALGVRQLRRHPSRTALTVAVVAISVMVAIGFGSSIRASMRDIERWADRISRVDFFVRGTYPDPATMTLATPLPAELAGELAALPGAGSVRRINFVPVTASGLPALLIAADYPAELPLAIDIRRGDPATIAARLAAGEAVVGSGLARDAGLNTGGTIRLGTREGPRAVPIAAIASEYTSGGRNLMMDWETARRLLGFEGVHVFALDARRDGQPGGGRADDRASGAAESSGAASPAHRALRTGSAEGPSADAPAVSPAAALAQALEGFCRARSLTLQSRAGFSEMVHDYLREITASMVLILAMVFLVALLGIVNTLTMGVLEQTREIGMLRAVGLRTRQIARATVSQALAIGVAGMAPGLAGGVAMAYAMNLSTYPVTGLLIEFSLSPRLIGAILASSLVVAALGAWPAARRACRVAVVAALRNE